MKNIKFKREKKLLSLALAFCMMTSMFSLSNFQASAHTYKGHMSLNVVTGDEWITNTDGPGTNNDVTFKLKSRGKLKIEQLLDGNGDDFEENDNDMYEYDYGELLDPWMYDNAGFHLGNNLQASPCWQIAKANLKLTNPFNTSRMIDFGNFYYEKEWFVKNEEKYKMLYTGRHITDIKSFTDMFINDFFIGTGEKESIDLTVSDPTITDQYGTYNPYNHAEPPKFSVNVPDDYSTFFTTSGNNEGLKFSINNKDSLLIQMRQKNTFDLSCNANWIFPMSGAYDYEKIKSFNIHRLEYQTPYVKGKIQDPQKPTGAIVGVDNNYYFNKSNPTLKWTAEYRMPTTIYDKWDKLTNKPVVKIYSGSGTTSSNLIGTANVTLRKGGSGIGYLDCTFTVPDNYTTNGNGISIAITNTDIPIEKQGTYRLGAGVGSTEMPYVYFSEYKIDTTNPSTQLVNKSGNPLVLNKMKNAQNFYIKSNENLAGGTAKFSLAENGKTEKIAFKQLAGLENKTVKEDTRAVTQNVLDVEYRLALADSMEGYYDLLLNYQDIAKNMVDQKVTKIPLDNKAPSIDLSVTTKEQDVTGSKRSDYKFKITDFQKDARVYYCFVPEGTSLDESGAKDAEENKGNDVIKNKWYFVAQSGESSTAVLKVNRGQNFEGKLYYYGDDGVSNKTEVKNMDANIYNADAEGSIVIKDDTPALSAYDIRFNTMADNVVSYQWVEKNKEPSGFEMDMTTYYHDDENVGAANQRGKDGKDYVMNGSYTLKYEIKNQTSGNTIKHEKDFVFDNSNPKISLPVWDYGQRVRDTQVVSIQMSDLSSITEAYYQVTDLKGNPEKGYETKKELTIDENGNVNTTFAISGLSNGVYGLKLYAKDKNGFEKSAWYGGSEGSFDDNDQEAWDVSDMTFAIRSKAPTMSVEVLNVDIKDEDQYYTTKQDYQLKLDVRETMKNLETAKFFDNYIKYQVSADGLTWGDWLSVPDHVMEAEAGAFTGTITLDNPIPLKTDDGMQNLYVRTACFSSGDKVSATTSPTMISSVYHARIIKDTTGPTGNVSYKELNKTTKDVEASLELLDNLTDVASASVRVRDADNDRIVLEKDTSGSSKYKLTIKENVDTTLITKDRLGNEGTVRVFVSNIDRKAPELTGSANTINQGERIDANVNITIKEVDPAQVKIALASGADVTKFTQEDYDRYDEYCAKGWINAITNDVTLPSGEINRDYKLQVKGFDGTWTIGVSASDLLGNKQEKNVASFTIKNAEPTISSYEFEPKITKSSTTATINFNVPVVVLAAQDLTDSESENLEIIRSKGLNTADSEMVTQIQRVYTEKQTPTFYISDSIGNAKKVTISMDDVSFIEGYKTTITYNKNDNVFDALDGTWQGFGSQDNITAVIEANPAYAGQYFYVDQAALIDMEIDETASVKAAYNDATQPDVIPEVLQGKQLYTKLVLRVKHNGNLIKTMRFNSYTLEGNEEERLQDEIITLDKLDETAPEAEVSFNTDQPTNQDVIMRLTAKDAQSGIVKIEEKTTSTEYITAYENEQGNATVEVKSTIVSNDDVHTFRITNRAGMVYEKEVRVNNIDKDPIEEGKHFTIVYEYLDIDKRWKPTEEGRAYRSVRARVIPTLDSGKQLKTMNNQGAFEVLLDEKNSSFDMQLQDEAGNAYTQHLSWETYDTVGPIIAKPEFDTKLTNDNIDVIIRVEDMENDGILTNCTLQLQNGKPITLEEVSKGEYKGSIPENGNYVIKAWDYAGNESTSTFTVTNIDRVEPKVTSLIYSVGKDIITSKSVVVTAETFSKHVQDFTIEAVSEDGDLSFVNYKEGSNEIRFLRNGSVNLLFRDDYGNIGSQLITVTNIKTTAPRCEAIVTYSEDKLQANVTFKAAHTEGVMDDDLRILSIRTPMLNAGKVTELLDKDANPISIKIKENGTYNFKILDKAGNTQEINVDITEIDKSAPKVLAIEWDYEYLDKDNNWDTATNHGEHQVSGEENEFQITDQVGPYTNQDVKVTVRTDKEISQIGSNYGTRSKESSMVYTANGLFSFNLEAANGTSALYGVGVNVIDKEKPVITFKEEQELVFVEDATEGELSYDKAKLLDYHAVDSNNEDLTKDVHVEFGDFKPDDINSNTFDRNKPYYIVYSVRDKAGNITELTRTIRLIALTDTVALVNGRMPAGNVSSVEGNKAVISLKNFSGKAYVHYQKGSLTMGEMKSRGAKLASNNKGEYVLNNLEKGWYTVNIQTDKKDFFNLTIYVNP